MKYIVKLFDGTELVISAEQFEVIQTYLDDKTITFININDTIVRKGSISYIRPKERMVY